MIARGHELQAHKQQSIDLNYEIAEFHMNSIKELVHLGMPCRFCYEELPEMGQMQYLHIPLFVYPYALMRRPGKTKP